MSKITTRKQLFKHLRFLLSSAVKVSLAAAIASIVFNLVRLVKGRKDEKKLPPRFPLAKRSKYWFLYMFIGHLADVRPWTRDGGGIALQLIDCRFHWYKTAKNKILETVRAQVGYDDYIFTKDLDIVQSFHGREDTLFRNSDTLRRAWARLFPKSIAVLTGEDWKRIRRVFVAAMNKLDYEVIPASTNEVLERSMHAYVTEDRQEVVLWDIFAKVTFDSFHKFMYNINFNTVGGENLDILGDLMTIAYNVSDRLMIYVPFLWDLPTETNRKIYGSHKRLVEFVDNAIKERSAKMDRGDYSSNFKFTNLLDAFVIAAKNEAVEGKKLTIEEIRAQLCAVMFGGFDTTTSSLSFIFMNLAKNPKYQQKVHDEVKNIDLTKTTKRELDDLPWLNGVINESLRLNAVGPLIARVANEDITIKGHYVKKGTNVLMDHYSLGQIPKYWKNAQDLKEYKPERWFNFTPVQGTFIPFGMGGRRCPGYKVARSQMMIIVAFMMKNYTIELSEKPIKIVASLGVTVSRDSSIVVNKRK